MEAHEIICITTDAWLRSHPAPQTRDEKLQDDMDADVQEEEEEQ
jgi:hypothetical protein